MRWSQPASRSQIAALELPAIDRAGSTGRPAVLAVLQAMSLSMSELIAAENAQKTAGENSFASSNFIGKSDATTTPTK